VDLDDKFVHESFRDKLATLGMNQQQILFLCCTDNRYVRMH
jgi:carbonic anhydrase